MLKIHFLNVGHGDCCIIEFIDGSRTAMVDINRTSEMDEQSLTELAESFSISLDSLYGQSVTAALESAGYDIELQDPIVYLNNINKSSIFRFISTHPHIDHLSGLNALNDSFSISNVWIIKNKYAQDFSKLSDSQKEDWNLYKSFRDTEEGKLNGTTIIRPEEGSEASFYTEDGIKILAPNDDLKKAGDTNVNEMSYVLLIQHKGKKIILGGDAEEATWKYLMEEYPDELRNVAILKAAHHGRDSGYYQPAVKHMSPTVTIVSVGKKPKTDASNKYKQYCDNVWSTRWKGNIVLTIDDQGKITYTTQYDR